MHDTQKAFSLITQGLTVRDVTVQKYREDPENEKFWQQYIDIIPYGKAVELFEKLDKNEHVSQAVVNKIFGTFFGKKIRCIGVLEKRRVVYRKKDIDRKVSGIIISDFLHLNTGVKKYLKAKNHIESKLALKDLETQEE